MFIYFATITDYNNQPVLTLEYTGTAKHAAFIASKYVDNCPPAGGFKISKRLIKPTEVAALLNHRGA